MGVSATDVDELLLLLEGVGAVLDDLTHAPGFIQGRDRDDDFLAAAAVVACADCLVTGDKDLLEDAELRAYLNASGVQVYTPRKFAEELGLV